MPGGAAGAADTDAVPEPGSSPRTERGGRGRAGAVGGGAAGPPPDRPTVVDYASHLLDDFHELHGDRLAEDCPAIVGGLGRLHGRTVMLIGHHKGGPDLSARQRCAFGMPTPAATGRRRG
ncbi:hypothetical protein NKH77_41655 [Streptomyces sp. M19]